MSAEPGSITRHADQFVPIAQSTERARPKRQVAGESPAGDTTSFWIVDLRFTIVWGGRGQLPACPQGPQSSQRSRGFHKPAASGAAPETATSLRSSSYGSESPIRACRAEAHSVKAGLHAAACGFPL